MTVGTVGQNQTIKLPVPDATLAVDGAQGDGQGNAALFAGLLAQLTNSDAEAQGSGDEQPAGADAAAEQSGPATDAAAEQLEPATGASVLPAPAALQALLANALSNIVQDVKQETQLNAAAVAGTGSDVLKLAQMIAKSAQSQDAVSPGAVAADAGEGKELKGITATLEAWADGPYAVAAPTTGAKEKRPMELSVVNVETHFAPVLAAEAAVPVELKAKAAALPAELKRLATSTTVKADETAVTAGAAAGVKVETDAKPQGDGNTDTASRGKPAPLPDAPEAATSNAAPVTIEAAQPPGQPVPVVRQIANDIAGAVQGASPATLQPIDVKPGLSKLKVLHIQLQPESLGTVTVKLALRADTLEVHIDAARAETADLIRRDRAALSSLLRAVGYRADDAQIIVTHADPATLTASSDGSLGSSPSGAQAGSQSGSQQSGSQQSGSQQSGSQQSGSQAAGERSANSQGRDGSGSRRERGEDGTSREREAPGARRTEAAGIYL